MKELIDYILENRGHDFEGRYKLKFDTHYKKLLETEVIDPSTNAIIKIQLPKYYKLIELGKRDTKRPITVLTNSINIQNGKTSESGNDIADYRIVETDKNGKDINNGFSLNLSLKYGKTITYLNCGMTQYISKFEPIGNGEHLFDFFGIDKVEFKKTFDVYKKRNEDSKTIPVINKIDKNKILEFLRQVLGYNYILIHEIGNTVEHYDLRKEDQCKKFIGDNINKAEVIYPQGRGKYVKVVIELDNRICNIVFRNKKGGIEPKEMLVTFKEK